MPIKGIDTPYFSTKSRSKRITSSLITERLRASIDEPHMSMSVPIATIYPGKDPTGELLAAVQDERDFIDDGLSGSKGLQAGSIKTCIEPNDFEKAIEKWYKAAGWIVV